MHFTKKLFLGGCMMMTQVSFAHGPVPTPLIDAPVPPVPGLVDGPNPIITDADMAIALGKALFWDINVGSDGIACASCHFNAGADHRIKNQLNPGDKGSLATSQTFETMPSGQSGGPNYTLNIDDFPLYQFNDPFDSTSGIIFKTDDVITSSGTFSGEFKGASRFSTTNDTCDRNVDPVFHVNQIGTRRVEPRNAPTVINAVFNHRNFWDGRANNVFNGSSNWGDRDPNAGVWIKSGPRSVVKERLHLINSSLASQAAATIFSTSEMVCDNRKLADLGRKLLSRKPLQYQKVHNEDSVFAPLNLTSSTPDNLQPGLDTRYRSMIRTSFDPKYWSYKRRGPFGRPAIGIAYNQMEANFSMFFALALQMYESTLISDQAPIDLTPRNPITLTPTWQNMGYTPEEIEILSSGFSTLEGQHCNVCHAGPLGTSAAIVTNSALVTPTPGKFFGPEHSRIAFGPNALGEPDTPGANTAAENAGITPHASVVAREPTVGGGAFIDFGFMATNVADPDADPGLDNSDDFGNPLSFSAQYVEYLLGNNSKIVDTGAKIDQQRVCDFRLSLTFSSINSPLDQFFTGADDIEIDGTREGRLRNQDCIKSDSTAYIPTPAAALANLNARKMYVGTKGVFKIPTLRNIELTGPYMHNGSMATLEQVVEFYSRNGNVNNLNKHSLLDSIALGEQANTPEKIKSRADLVSFLKIAYTDNRVRFKQAPFDHPELVVPNGHLGDHEFATAGNSIEAILAKDEFLIIPAVGANGTIDPVQPFEDQLAQ